MMTLTPGCGRGACHVHCVCRGRKGNSAKLSEMVSSGNETCRAVLRQKWLIFGVRGAVRIEPLHQCGFINAEESEMRGVDSQISSTRE